MKKILLLILAVVMIFATFHGVSTSVSAESDGLPDPQMPIEISIN